MRAHPAWLGINLITGAMNLSVAISGDGVGIVGLCGSLTGITAWLVMVRIDAGAVSR